ncbi:hypothetical protein OQA88_2267 [Cercophora sp. LCS_1]
MESTTISSRHVRDIPTKSVTLFPTRAQVVRELKDVPLKPGSNEITIVGVTPTADEHSIKVEGTGSAIITDITVELLPNRDIFEEIYPDMDDEDEYDESDDDDDDDEAEAVNKALEEVQDKIQGLVDEQMRAKEIVSSAESRLKILDAHGNSLERKRNVEIESSIETYRKEREKVFQDHLAGIVRERELAKEIKKLRVEQARLEKIVLKEKIKAAKAKAKVEREKAKLRVKEDRRKQEQKKEKARIRKERENFWARYCYSVRITLEGTNFTPDSSRRSSIASASDLVKVVSEKEPSAVNYTCDLQLSYVTSSAFWSPSYDLALSTTSNTAVLCFDAQLTNMTSETWDNTKVTLSTSQTTFSGLQDAIPTLVPWRVKLGGRWTGGTQSDLVDSREERVQQGVWQAAQVANTFQKPRAQLFGLTEQPQTKVSQQLVQQYQAEMQCAASMPVQSAQKPGAATSLFGARPQSVNPAPVGGGLFGGSSGFGASAYASNIGNDLPRGGAPNMNSLSLKKSKERKASPLGAREASESFLSRDIEEEDDADGATILEPTPELSFQESSFEETGLTATYDLPNLKTLKPATTASKQRVARISFTNVYFSHTVVAKYKPVAYLKAKLRNTSKLTLLKGPTGLTLDGTFMGRSTLPRCSAGDSFTMSLGVDPAIKVSYPKPDVKRSTTGVFTKGDNSVYTRTVTLVNTRATAGKAVNITVLDQVPVSEDEKLRIDVQQPRGLYAGAPVPTGVPGKDGKEEKEWGRASAVLKKAGEVSWDVVLNAGKSVRLVLEYDVSLPAGERVIQC